MDFESPKKLTGEAVINGNKIFISGDTGTSYNQLNTTTSPLKNNQAFVKQIPKGQKRFKVKFNVLNGKNIDVSSLEIAKDEVESADTILKNIPALRESEVEEFSKLLDLSTGVTKCSASSPLSGAASATIPPHARIITIRDILLRADEGIEKSIAEINQATKEGKPLPCVACGKAEHSKEAPMSFTTFYYLNESSPTEKGKLSPRALHRLQQLSAVLKARNYCECDLKAIPRSPCNVFRRVSSEEKDKIDKAYEGDYAKNLRNKVFPEMLDEIMSLAQSASDLPVTSTESKPVFFKVLTSIDDQQRINHIVPRSGGGCPTKTFDIVTNSKGKVAAPANLIPIWNMCHLCQLLDELFTKWQNNQKHETLDLYIRNVIEGKGK
jgi:hypothetical protein